MKSIKERANEYAPDIRKSDSMFPTVLSTLVAIERRGYIAGATDQKAIDIEKAKTAFNNACGWLSTYPWYSEVVNKFIKNMEE